MSLKSFLCENNKLKWLDIGCGGRYDEGFDYLDILDCSSESIDIQKKYNKLDIISITEKELSSLGRYDFVRLQHTLEHFSVEDGFRCLLNCAKILNEDGIILITVPDLRVFIKRYLDNSFQQHDDLFKHWALQRIPADSPSSFYFSIFTHSIETEAHKWCYDKEGLLYLLEKSALFEDITILPIDHDLAIQPFTHNRPGEDLCVMAKKK